MRLAIFLFSLAVTANLPAPAAASQTRIDFLSNSVVARSGPVTINGSGFGKKDAGSVLIEGARAWTTQWSDSQIVAYVPESAKLGANTVEVLSGGQRSEPSGLVVEERPATTGTVAWRFEVLANYISHRADVGRDGTVYFNDSSGFLYALTPEGGLKWVYDGKSGGSSGPTAVGADGTIYFGVSSPFAAIHAVNPDGSRKWIFSAPASQGPIGGPNIGPDGNLYAVFDLPGSFGAVSLTPEGALRWNNPGNPRVAEYGQLGRELVFSRRDFFFTSTYYGDIYGFNLAQGTQDFLTNIGTADQAATARDGTLYVPNNFRLNSYARNGVFRWSFFGEINPPTNDLTAPDVDKGGNIYISRNLSELYSLTPAPTVRWVVPSLLAGGPIPGPIVSPKGDLVLMGGQETYGRPGLIQGFSAFDGALLFEINIPKEPDGTCAVPYARARFNRRGDRAYIPAAQLCEAPKEYHSWLYAIDVIAADENR